jgi:hypothetical protein
MRQVQGAPLGVVKPGLCESEFASLGKVTLSSTKSQITGWVSAVAELKLPAKVEEQPLAWRDDYRGLGGVWFRSSR